MKNIFILLSFFSASAFGNEACTSYLGVKVNGFIGETLESLAKTSDCNENLKTLKFNSIEGQVKSDYCACISTNPKSLSGKSLTALKSDPKYKESKGKSKKVIEEKYAKALRSKIFGTLSRSFKFDNLAKRGYLSNEIAKDKASNNCKLDNILLNIENFKGFKDENPTCLGKDKLFEERKKLLFPEGEEAFIQNLKDTANTVAKGVRANGSCLTYQNYLELNSTIPQNSEGVRILSTSNNWETFKSRVAEELRMYDNYKSLQNQMRGENKDLSYEASLNLWGFSGKTVRGKDTYRLLKANPSFELALRDKEHFEKLRNEINLFENKNSNGGFTSPVKSGEDVDGFFKENSESALKAHLKSCDSSDISAGRNQRGSAPKKQQPGLKQSIAMFLCSDDLPSPRIEDIDDSLDQAIGYKDKNNALTRDNIKSDYLCSSTPSNLSSFTDIDPLLNVASDLDVADSSNFLKDYKDFSDVFCKYADKECSNPQKAAQNPDCASLTSLADHSLYNVMYLFYKTNNINVVGNEGSYSLNKKPTLLFMRKLLEDPNLTDEDVITTLKKEVLEKFNISQDSESFKRLRDGILLLRSNTSSVKLYREAKPFIDQIPEKLRAHIPQYFRMNQGKALLEKVKDTPEGRIILGTLTTDTGLNFNADISNSIFADVFTNGHSSSGTANVNVPRYASSGPEVDTEYLIKGSSEEGTPNQPPILTNTGTLPSIKGQIGTGIMPKGTGFNPKTLPRDLAGSGSGLPDNSTSLPSRDIASTGNKIRSLDDLMARAVPPETTVTKNNDVVVKQEPSKDLVDNKGVNEPNIPASGGVSKNNSWSNAVGSFGLTRSTSELEEDSFANNSDSNINLRNNSSDSNLNSYNSTNSERIGGFGKMFDSQQSERQKILAEIKDLETKIRESRNNNMNDEEAAIREREESNSRLKQRIADLENQVDRRSRNYQSNSYNSFDSNSPYGNSNEGTPRRLDNPRDPFNRAETGREVTPEHMDTVDPAGSSLSNKGSSKGNNANKVGLAGAGAKKSNGEILESLGLKPIKKRGLASNDGEPDPETLCGFEDQELNCIFEHSEIYMRFERRQIISLVENLLLHGHTFKTIEVLSNRDPSIPKKYIVHFFEPDKNLSYEDKVKQLDLIKKMLLDYKKNYSFLKSIASKVTRTKSVEISKKEAFTILKHTLKKTDIDKLIKRRLGLIERLPANTKK